MFLLNIHNHHIDNAPPYVSIRQPQFLFHRNESELKLSAEMKLFLKCINQQGIGVYYITQKH